MTYLLTIIYIKTKKKLLQFRVIRLTLKESYEYIHKPAVLNIIGNQISKIQFLTVRCCCCYNAEFVMFDEIFYARI